MFWAQQFVTDYSGLAYLGELPCVNHKVTIPTAWLVDPSSLEYESSSLEFDPADSQLWRIVIVHPDSQPTIHGKVLDESGVPQAGAKVSAWGDSPRRPPKICGSARVDPDGSFRLRQTADSPEKVTLIVRGTFGDGAWTADPFVASTLVLYASWGDEVEFALRRPGVGSLELRAYTEAGIRIEEFGVRVYQNDWSPGENAKEKVTTRYPKHRGLHRGGTLILESLAAGSYWVNVVPSDPAHGESVTTLATVAAGDRSTIHLQAPAFTRCQFVVRGGLQSSKVVFLMVEGQEGRPRAGSFGDAVVSRSVFEDADVSLTAKRVWRILSAADGDGFLSVAARYHEYFRVGVIDDGIGHGKRCHLFDHSGMHRGVRVLDYANAEAVLEDVFN